MLGALIDRCRFRSVEEKPPLERRIEPRSDSRTRLDVINGLRGVAICGVVWHHLFGLYFKPESALYRFGHADIPYFFLSYGWIGVQLFFVLSGFVLFLPIAQNRRRLETFGDCLAFYRRRAQRLLPLFYFSAFLCLLLNQVAPIGEVKFLLEIVSVAGVLFPFVTHGFQPYFNPPLWSLGVEIWFSILFPFIAMAFQRVGAAKIIAITMLVSWISRYLGHTLPHAGGTSVILPLVSGLSANLEIFAAGMALAHGYASVAPAGRLVRRPRLYVLCGAAVVTIAIWSKQSLLPGLGMDIVFADAITLGFALAIAGLLSMPAGRFRMAFANRPLQLLGMMCFSLYIWHEPLLRHVFMADAAPLDDLAWNLPIYLVLLLAVGGLSYRYIEFGHSGDWRGLFLVGGERQALGCRSSGQAGGSPQASSGSSSNL